VVLALVKGLSANIIYVDVNLATALTTAPCGATPATACSCIKLALDIAVEGDTIQLAAGVYTGPLNVGLTISIAGIRIVGAAGLLSIIDCGSSTHAFLVVQPCVVFVNLLIKNGLSVDVSLAGAITVRLNVGVVVVATISLQNVHFVDITGGALLFDCVPASSTSTVIVVQVELLGVVFVNIALKPALTVLGSVQVQLKNCQFDNNGLASVNVSTNTSVVPVVGSCIYVAANVLGIKATVSLSGCTFVGNHGSSLIHVGCSVSGDELVFVGTNSFLNNVCTSAIIDTNINLSVVLCLDCNTVWSYNSCPLLCKVACGLLNIGLLCPHSCPILGIL
jgi:hypothetical protein